MTDVARHLEGSRAGVRQERLPGAQVRLQPCMALLGVVPVPGQVVPGLQGAFWTAAALGSVSFTTALGLTLATRRRPAGTIVISQQRTAPEPVAESVDAA